MYFAFDFPAKRTSSQVNRSRGFTKMAMLMVTVIAGFICIRVCHFVEMTVRDVNLYLKENMSVVFRNTSFVPFEHFLKGNVIIKKSNKQKHTLISTEK